MLDGDPAPPPKQGRSSSPIFGPFLLRPNGCMDQDATWYGDRPRPRRHRIRWGTSTLLKRGAEPLPNFRPVYCGQTAGWIKMALGMEVGLSPADFLLDGDTVPLPKRSEPHTQIFGPCLLWPNGWMDQDATSHEGRPQPRRLCVRWGPSPLPKKKVEPPPAGPPQFSAHFYCGQTAGCIKMPLGMEVGLSAGDFVLDMWTSCIPLQKGGRAPPQFVAHVYCGQMTAGIKIWYGGRMQPRRLCAKWGPRSLPKKGAEPPIFGPCLLQPNG